MDLVRCENGHFYDREKYKICPHCVTDTKKNKPEISRPEITRPEIFNTENKYHNSSIAKKIFLNLGKWFIQIVLFSLIPLFFVMLIHWMFHLQEPSLNKCISELCSFTLVVSSSTATELAKKKYVNTKIKEVVFPAYLILLILFFMLYGATVISFELKVSLESEILNNIFLAVLLISIIHLIIGGLLQVLGGLYDE